MINNAKITKTGLKQITLTYDIGFLKNLKNLTGGSVQTNILFQTSKGKFVFRYYSQGRVKRSVEFEINLIRFLRRHKYPCPAPIKNKAGRYIGCHNNKPYVIFEYIDGQHLEKPNENQKKQLIKKVAELSTLTQGYKPKNIKYRWNYNKELFRKLAKKEVDKLNTQNAKEKFKWYEKELLRLILPQSLPKGICHADFHFSNVSYKNGEFKSLIDFDDANYTYLMLDLVGLIESWAWRYRENKELNFNEAKKIVKQYIKHRPLNDNEKKHLFDVYKFSILIDCVWYFKRGKANNFKEKKKIEFLEKIGRKKFYEIFFS